MSWITFRTLSLRAEVRMTALLLLTALAVLTQEGSCSPDQPKAGCKRWRQDGENVCCEECRAGNRLVTECGPKADSLCKPCQAGFYNLKAKAYSCTICTQCVGAQVLLEKCTATSDTKCGCKEGLTCGDAQCSFCVEKCGRGFELVRRSCKPCPAGTFRDESLQKCKPWSTECPNPGELKVAEGNASSDIQCVKPPPMGNSKKPDQTSDQLAVLVAVGSAVMAVFIMTIIIATVALKTWLKKRREKPAPQKPVISPPTDDPRTLIAVECSFHEPRQEQGSSTESLISKTSRQLIA
ncbi:tumor necrosis factor receptor superfamily member 9a isoform 1-T2 [Menidia menidia]